MAVGRVVLVAGVLVLLFIPYLLWGTGLMTARSQDALRTQFGIDQRSTGAAAVTKPKTPTTPAVTLTAKVAPTIADPPVGSPVGIISIPKINLSMMVVEGTGEAQLAAGPGHYTGTPLPGEAGNAAIAGHRTTYLHPFYNLNELGPGDSIVVTTLQGIFLYQVVAPPVAVSPTDVSVVDATSSPMLTLTTCNPRYSAAQRLVVSAKLTASALSLPKVAAVAKAKRVANTAVVSTSVTKSWPLAILWGALVAALTTALWIGVKRTRRGRRAGIAAGGIVVWLVVVFFFFEAVAPLLPASY